jgi:hypothetical protein
MPSDWPDEAVQSDEPTDRLTNLANDILGAIEAHANYRPDDQAIVFVHGDGRGGVGTYGFEDSKEAIAALFVHMRAMFHANGLRLDIMGMDDDGIVKITDE